MKVKKENVVIHSVLLISMTTVIYYTNKWKLQKRDLLHELQEHIESDYTERSADIYKSVRRQIVGDVNREVFSVLRRELTSLTTMFLPGGVGDHELVEHFVHALRDDLYKNLCGHVRDVIKGDLNNILKQVIDKTKNEVVSKTSGNKPKMDSSNLCSIDKVLPANQRVLVYSLFGPGKEYYREIHDVMNEVLASNLYNNWRVRIYHDSSVRPHVIEKYRRYKTLDFCDVRKITEFGDISNIIGPAWRNIPMADQSVDVVCSRDLYSPLLPREEDAVNEFLSSDKFIHSIRDHPSHKIGLVENTWCIKPSLDRTRARIFVQNLLNHARTHKEDSDQDLVNRFVWNHIGDKSRFILQHDSYSCEQFKSTRPFPKKRTIITEYVGCPDRKCYSDTLTECPEVCRPDGHDDWLYC